MTDRAFNRRYLTPAERARRAAVRERARRAEERRAIIREAMSLIGSATTPAKRRAARKNGKQGGRPRLSPGANTKAPTNPRLKLGEPCEP